MNVIIPVSGIALVGEIPRFDLTPTGPQQYDAWLFAKSWYDWRSELRMPLIQQHLAKEMHVSAGDVAVGLYCLDTGVHDKEVYSNGEIQTAQAEIARLVPELTTSTDDSV